MSIKELRLWLELELVILKGIPLSTTKIVLTWELMLYRLSVLIYSNYINDDELYQYLLLKSDTHYLIQHSKFTGYNISLNYYLTITDRKHQFKDSSGDIKILESYIETIKISQRCLCRFRLKNHSRIFKRC